MAVIETLLEITIYSTVIFAVIMLIKTSFRNKMSPFLHFALWSLFLIRLILPVTIESSVHLITLPAQTSMSNQEAVQDGQNDAFDFMTPSSNTYSKEQHALYWETSNTEAQNAVQSSSAATAMSQDSRLTLPQILLIVWLGGVAVCLCYFAALAILLKRKLKKRTVASSAHILTLVQQVKDELGIKSKIKLLCQDECGTPALLLPRTVFLPMRTLAAMDDEQVKNCIRHECMHYKRGDQYINLLLLILNAVYWFNPIVWLAFYQVRRDMETACDGAVVRRMDTPARRDYATLILGMFSQAKYGQIALGMTQGSTKKIAEQRIKGIFMRNKSGKSVRFVAAALTVMLFVCCFTTACQPTPDKEIVLQKDMERLIGMATSEDEIQGSGSLAEKLNAPTTYTSSFEGYNGDLSVNIDAEVKIPNADGISVTRVSKHSFTQKEADKMMNVFLHGATLYEVDQTLTKEEIQSKLIIYYGMRDGSIPMNVDGENPNDMEKLLQIIADYEDLLPNAPETKKLTPADIAFHPYSFSLNPEAEVIEGMTIVNGKSAYLFINNGAFGINDIKAVFINAKSKPDNNYHISPYKIIDDEEMTYLNIPKTFTITPEEAQNAADDILNQLGISNMNCVKTQYAVMVDQINADADASNAIFTSEQLENGKWAYCLQYQRLINGVPITLTSQEGTSHENEHDVSEPWPYEKLEMIIDGSGVVYYGYNSPYDLQETVTEDATLFEFSEIISIFEKMFPITYGYLDEEGTDYCLKVDIYEIRLGLMRIIEQNSYDTALLIPVWDFFGNVTVISNDEEPYWFANNSSLLTINAIDGTIIDRSLGY